MRFGSVGDRVRIVGGGKLTLTDHRQQWESGKGVKKLSPKGGREGGEKKCVHSMPVGAGARTQDLSHTRRGSVAAHHGACFDLVSFAVAIDMLTRLRNHQARCVWSLW